MIQRILADTATDADVAEVQAYAFDERKRLLDHLLSALDEKFEETLFTERVLEDVGNAIKQSRPVFAAGLPVDQALGFITGLIQQSIDELESAGGADSDDYEKQQRVLETVNGFIEACNEAGTTQGEDALETVRCEYRTELGKLEALKAESEAGIANSIAFLVSAYESDDVAEALVAGLDRHSAAMRFIGTFGSPSFFAFKHVGAPGEISGKAVGSQS